MLIDIINIVNIASVYKTAIIFQEIDGNNRLSLFCLLDSMRELYQNKVINDCEGGYRWWKKIGGKAK